MIREVVPYIGTWIETAGGSGIQPIPVSYLI